MLLAMSLLHCVSAVRAEEPRPTADVTVVDSAARLRGKAWDLRRAADARRATEEADCRRRFLVESCLSESQARHRDASVAADSLEREARRLERGNRQAGVTPKSRRTRLGQGEDGSSERSPGEPKLKAVEAQRDLHLRSMQEDRATAESAALQRAKEEATRARRQPVGQARK